MKSIKWRVRLDTKGLGIKIYINDLLFLYIKDYKDFIGIQSWKEGKDYYHIEVYTINKTIKLEFNDMAKWVSILKLFDEL